MRSRYSGRRAGNHFVYAGYLVQRKEQRASNRRTGSSADAAGGAEADKKRHVICISDGCLEEIGEYATKERCLEVLDEIQKACVSYLFTAGGAAIVRGGMDVQPFAAVIPRLYEMPEK